MKYTAVIVAAGSGQRLGYNFNKIFVKFNDKILIEYSIDYFLKNEYCNQIVIVASIEDFDRLNKTYSSDSIKVIIGGDFRQDSVFKSLKHVSNDYIVVHDAARPIISDEFITYYCTHAESYPVMTVGSQLRDTVHIGNKGYITELIDRDSLYSVYTPQAFKKDILLDAHTKAVSDSFIGTDDISLVLNYTNIQSRVYLLEEQNIKLTTKQDIVFLEALLNENR